MNNLIKTYSELIKFDSFIERFNYVKLRGRVGEATFGFDRYLNQILYHDTEWQRVRRHVALRDSDGDDILDLGFPGRPIAGSVFVHHINPISEEDILERRDWILDPEFLISTSLNTHNAIHYGDESLLIHDPVIRRPNDTCPWR